MAQQENKNRKNTAADPDDLDLKFNEKDNSYELDIESDNPDYQHEDPYDSTAPNGEDDNSGWDEANPYVSDEYDKDKSLETDAEGLSMHIDNGRITRLNKADRKLAETPEDERTDLDEEGYPKKN